MLYFPFIPNTVARTRLRGMVITGIISLDVNGNQLYKDTSTKTSCSTYPKEGTSVCSDIIKISIISNQLARFIKISTTDYLNLCEVQVFAGKPTFRIFLCNISNSRVS